MKLIALETETPGVTAEQIAPHLREEAQVVWELQQAGIIREAYFRADRRSAVLVLESECSARAHEALAALPLVRHGLIAFDVIPLVPYSGFSRLFADNV